MVLRQAECGLQSVVETRDSQDIRGGSKVRAKDRRGCRQDKGPWYAGPEREDVSLGYSASFKLDSDFPPGPRRTLFRQCRTNFTLQNTREIFLGAKSFGTS